MDGEGLEKFPDRERALPRRFRIDQRDLDAHGYTDGCSHCDHILRYGTTRPGTQHSDTCRSRVMVEIGKTPAGQERLRRREEAVDRAMAEHLEKHDAAQKRVPASEAGMSAPRSLVGTDEAAAPKHPETEDDLDDTIVYEGALPVPASNSPPVSPTSPSVNDPAISPEHLGSGGGISGGANMEMAFIEDDEPMMLLAQMLPGGRSYAREKRSAFNKLVSEMYSPPRITRMLSRLPNNALVPGMALDLTVTDPSDGCPWDFDIREKRERARALLRKQRPLFLVGTPMCTAFCTWQRLNDLRRDLAKMKAEGPEERASLALEIQKLRNFKRTLDDKDTRLPEAKRLLSVMRVKLEENIGREGRKTEHHHEVDKRQRNLALATEMSDDVNKKWMALGKTMATSLQQFKELQRDAEWANATALKEGRKATALCNRVLAELAGEIDKTVEESDGTEEKKE